MLLPTVQGVGHRSMESSGWRVSDHRTVSGSWFSAWTHEAMGPSTLMAKQDWLSILERATVSLLLMERNDFGGTKSITRPYISIINININKHTLHLNELLRIKKLTLLKMNK